MSYELHLGDCLEVMKGMPAGSIDAIVTDPPYGIGKADWDGDIWEMLTQVADECARVLSPTGVCFWFSSIRYLPETIKATAAIPYRWQFIWYAPNNMQHGDLGFMKYTPCLVLSHGKAWRNMQDFRSVPIPTSPIGTIGHPTQKPKALMRYLVHHAAKQGATILDPFMGSGTTIVAAILEGRKAIGIELDAGYYAIAQKRCRDAAAQPLLLPIHTQPEPITQLELNGA